MKERKGGKVRGKEKGKIGTKTTREECEKDEKKKKKGGRGSMDTTRLVGGAGTKDGYGYGTSSSG